ncbi:DUF1345 domain-containing protein [Ornithinimicrobium sp. Y1694]|uniref:DUF1345 domain-containing protein n=1 Tax=Ornithinimicrobium sp. Y1694 TaxID=3418590 RepID=UPI003CF3EB34
MDEDETARRFDQVDPSRSEIELLVLGGAAASLLGVGVSLFQGGSQIDAVIAVLTVVAGWLTVHTTYTLRYAKHYLLVEPGAIDFPGAKGRPRLSDFAYFAFNLGMTYQVSDTDLQTPFMRKLAWQHSMLSYLFGTVIIAVALNLLINLASSG